MSYTTILIRRDPAALWTANNPVLAEGELGFELDTGKGKIGNGVLPWNSLPYTITRSWEDLDDTPELLQGEPGPMGPPGPTGPAGPQGVQGERGADGTGVAILGSFPSEADLRAALPTGINKGDSYFINGDLWVWDGDEWVNVGNIQGPQGDPGAPGIPGNPGADGQTQYTWIKYADDAAGNGMDNSSVGKTYIGIAYNKPTDVESENPGDYEWTLIQGPQGEKGADGTGIAIRGTLTSATELNGIVGAQGDSYFINGDLWVWDGDEWVNVGNIQGPQGDPGAPGIPGNPGADGQTLYTWIRYADDINGNGISNASAGKSYIGVAYNQTSPTESENQNDYTWSLFKGADGGDGRDGIDGLGPRNATIYYYYNTAQASAPTAPTSSQVSYSFSNLAPSTSAAGWSPQFNPAALSNTNTGNNKYWAVRVQFQEDTYGGNVTTSVSSVFTWMNFDGLVTFSNLATGRNENGNVSTTLIDGGSIKTGTITADKISSGTSTVVGGKFSLGAGSSIAGYGGIGAFQTTSSSKFGVVAAGGSYASAIACGTTGSQVASISVNSTSTAYTTHNTWFNAAYKPTSWAAEAWNNTYAKGIQMGTSTFSAYLTGPVGPFTAAHDAIIDEGTPIIPGDILMDDEIFATKGVSDTISTVMLPSGPNEKGAIGVYVEDAPNHVPVCLRFENPSLQGLETNPDGTNDAQYMVNDVYVDPIYEAGLVGKKFISVNALGEGLINVVGEGGTIEKGDLIVTSSTPGKGMKQADDIVRGYTVARSRQTVTFDTPDQEKQIACVYLCG